MKQWRTGLFIVVFLAIYVGGAEAQEPVPSPGLIAYIGPDNNVYTLTPADDSRIQLTDDAGATRQYLWPTWSTDGRLAYFSLSLADQQFTTEAYVSGDGLSAGEQVYSGPDAFNYAYWAPSNCNAGDGCRDLAILLSSQSNGMFVELVRHGLETVSSLTAGTGGPPFYYSWSPDGSRMLWQRGNNSFDIYDVSTGQVIDTLDYTPGGILSPAWSPVDDRLLFGASNDNGGTDLVIVGDNEPLTLATGLTGLVSYNWSPDGTRLAYRELTRDGYGNLIVVDAATAEVVTSSFSGGVVSFFWSPDSQQVAYITLGAAPQGQEARNNENHLLAQGAQQSMGVRWSILDVNSGAIRQSGTFVPTSEMIYLLQYFDQFAQSHRVWSPDSQELLYSEITPDGPVIDLLDVSTANSIPVSVAEGVIGIWSF